MNLEQSDEDCCGISSSRVALHFGRSVQSYEREATFHAQLAKELLAGLVQRSSAPQQILEIGSHTGLLSRSLLEVFDQAHLLGVDLHKEGLTQMTQHPRWRALVGNGECLPFGKPTFDLVVSGATLQWFCRWEESVLNLFALLKPGGWLAFSQFLKPSLEPLRSEAIALGRRGSFLDMKEHGEVISFLKQISPDAEGTFLSRTDHHPHLKSILLHLRGMGVGASKENERPWSRSQLRKWESQLEVYRTEKGLPLQYGAGLYWIQRPLDSDPKSSFLMC